jgi:hypothetical protein
VSSGISNLFHVKQNAGACPAFCFQENSKLTDKLRQEMQMMLVGFYKHETIIPLMSNICDMVVFAGRIRILTADDR